MISKENWAELQLKISQSDPHTLLKISLGTTTLSSNTSKKFLHTNCSAKSQHNPKLKLQLCRISHNIPNHNQITPPMFQRCANKQNKPNPCNNLSNFGQDRSQNQGLLKNPQFKTLTIKNSQIYALACVERVLMKIRMHLNSKQEGLREDLPIFVLGGLESA